MFIMKKISLKSILFAAVFTLLTVFLCSAESASAFDAGIEPYKLSFITLLDDDPSLVRRLIDSDIQWSPMQRAVLDINLILRIDELDSLSSAVENLEKAADNVELIGKAQLAGNASIAPNLALYNIYRGMSEAFLARKKTIFGMPHLNKAEELFTAVPADYPDWYIRLLRGMSFYSVGRGLPDIRPLKELKQTALRIGESDLNYVLKKHRSDSIPVFRADDYDWSERPVPDSAAAFAAEALE